ncbi:MAG: ribonucleoside-diphosphate reductase, adenosylcobalamin-dependent [Planctomycetes bacterium RBG_16_64_10]|nr:MAG: ribonucleoside-diphosphate reductase, adenosylcobalamin-dependent [Planctomycetes bacterium RBG_16_64_10]
MAAVGTEVGKVSPADGSAAGHLASARSRSAGRLSIESVFCPPDVADPFETADWERRSAIIKGEKGEVLFEQVDCEVPASWSQLATNVVVSKYFYGEVGTPERESSVRQLIHRVCRTIADWGIQDGYFVDAQHGARFYRELAWLCLHQHGAFNSPVWFNVGLYHQYGVRGAQCNWHYDRPSNSVVQPANPYEYPQGSACFIQHVSDNMEDIMELARSEAMLFKFGSGTGTDLSTLRSHREKLSGGGRPSGPLSFMRVYDQIAAVVKSGGKTRRAAKMQSLKVWHPDIMEFIECKDKEERKARVLIEKGGYEANFNGEAYSSIMFQNANLSVRVTDEFMHAVERDESWATYWVTDPSRNGPTYQAREVMRRMAQCAWRCGDPGVQYDSTINRWHTCPNSGRINASNPCSEYMFLDDTACNLASINLIKFRRGDGTIDVERLQAAGRIFFIAQEILVDHASYPTREIARNSHLFRPLGLGYSNLGSLIMASGLPYDSNAARGLCGALTALLHGAANLASTELAAAVGPFAEYATNRESMLQVMQMHRNAVEAIDQQGSAYLLEASRRLWDQVLDEGARHGFRNAQATVLAPTGTISFMMDCDTTGIEPDIALVKYKQLAGRGMLKIVNQTVPLTLRALGYSAAASEAILAHIEQHDTIEGAADLRAEHLPIFDCAFLPRGGTRSIPWRAHIAMMAAAQPFLSGAISKTVNMPRETTPEDIAGAYLDGWRLGLKALAIYRDGSKESQPLSTSSGEKPGAGRTATPRRERLPDTRQSVTHKFNVAGHEGYITVGLYQDGRPGEVFLTMAKEGSTIGGLMDAFGTAISMSLQYGVPLEAYVNKFSHTRFEPMGYTKNPDIRLAKSIIDYIFRWLGITFLAGESDATGAAALDNATLAASTPAKPLKSRLAEKPATELESKMADSDRGRTPPAAPGPFPPEPRARTNGTAGRGKVSPRGDAPVRTADEEPAEFSEQFARFQTDAPACDHCGAITVRNGNCYLCYNCGNSMGCS